MKYEKLKPIKKNARMFIVFFSDDEFIYAERQDRSHLLMAMISMSRVKTIQRMGGYDPQGVGK